MSSSDDGTARDARQGAYRSWFERFVERTYLRVSGAGMFFLCVAVVAAWFASVPLWVDLKEWQVAIHTVGSVVTLLLLVLLENASRRADEAAQEKLNLIAVALAALMESHAADDAQLRDATSKLREAVDLEDRH